MILMPRERPVIQDLNSYYLDLERLVEHFQGQIGCGGVHLRSSSAEAALFFDETGIINGIHQSGQTLLRGQQAIDNVFQATKQDNFTVTVYRIAPVNVYFWASLSHAEPIYKDLSSEFTDLEALIKKMRHERLTGFIEVTIDRENESGLLFFNNGSLIESSCSWANGDCTPQNDQQRLSDMSREIGGVFNVSRVMLAEANHDAVAVASPSPPPATDTVDGLAMAQELLAALETAVAQASRRKTDFDTLLRRKFIEKADFYGFLDPFAGEFTYAGGQIRYTGNSDPAELCQAVAVCVRELTQQLGLNEAIRPELAAWRNKYAQQLETLKILI